MIKLNKFLIVTLLLISIAFAGCDGVNDVLEKSEESNIFDSNQSQQEPLPNEAPAVPPTGEEISVPGN